jgi:hypothetical protein
MARKILLVLLVLVAAVCAIVLTRPDTFHVERSATIHAPANVVFARLEDFHRWPDWSPWEKLDPNMVRTYSGPDRGVGAAYAWKGNDKVGEGRMTILEAAPPAKLGIQLEFLKPFPATNTATFTLAPAGDETRVTWAMDGKNNAMSKAFSLFMDMDKLVGTDFAKGLAALDSVAAADFAAYSPMAADSGAAR